MRIIGIDPGVERVGIAVIEKLSGGKEVLLYSDCFKTSSKLPHAERLALIGNEIGNVIKKWKPKIMGIEKLYFENNQKTAMVVAEARGVMLYEGKKNKLEIKEFTPLEIKVAVTGYGKSDKRAVMNMVPKLIICGDKKMIDDEVDAIAVGLTAFAYARMK